jgi:hypothetical protein
MAKKRSVREVDDTVKAMYKVFWLLQTLSEAAVSGDRRRPFEQAFEDLHELLEVVHKKLVAKGVAVRDENPTTKKVLRKVRITRSMN